jgi:hypothetical protein
MSERDVDDRIAKPAEVLRFTGSCPVKDVAVIVAVAVIVDVGVKVAVLTVSAVEVFVAVAVAVCVESAVAVLVAVNVAEPDDGGWSFFGVVGPLLQPAMASASSSGISQIREFLFFFIFHSSRNFILPLQVLLSPCGGNVFSELYWSSFDTLYFDIRFKPYLKVFAGHVPPFFIEQRGKFIPAFGPAPLFSRHNGYIPF